MDQSQVQHVLYFQVFPQRLRHVQSYKKTPLSPKNVSGLYRVSMCLNGEIIGVFKISSCQLSNIPKK